MNLAGYIRVSTEQQVDAYGKDVQRESIARWADLNGHTIVGYYEEDAVSGKVDGGDRPVLANLLHHDVALFDGIVFFDATRIARRSVVQETLLSLIWATGLKVFTTTAGELDADEEDPTKILIRQILGVIAEFDHRTTVRKLHAARKIKASQGGYIGGTPRFGVAVEGSGKSSAFVPNQDERRTIQLIALWHRESYSLREIADRLNEEGRPTKTGRGRWHPTQVARILDRPEEPTH